MVRIIQEYGPDEVQHITQLLVRIGVGYPILTFRGPIGAGKTTLIRSLLGQHGVEQPITSPTFTYVSCYRTGHARSVYHFDLYRIETTEQFVKMGFEEYLYEKNALVLIEWPTVIAPLLDSSSMCMVTLDYANDPEKRMITITAPGDTHEL